MNWAEFIAMGGYGLYVWTSYALATLVLVLNVILPLRQHKTVRARLREYHRVQQNR